MAYTDVDRWDAHLSEINEAYDERLPTKPAEPGLTVHPSAVEKLVMAFVRVRGLDRLDDALLTRAWLIADMKIGPEELDSLLRLLRWQGMVSLPDEHLVVVEDPAAMLEIALGSPMVMEIAAPRH